MNFDHDIPEQVFSAYKHLGSPIAIEAINIGLINKTYVVSTAQLKFIVQEVAPIFEVTVNDDSEAVSAHLEKMGITSPKIYKTNEQKLVLNVNGRIFRALKFISGKSHNTLRSLVMAESAGRALGQFHAAMLNFDYQYRSKRRHGGDYAFHRDNLITALIAHKNHEYYGKVKSLCDNMLATLDSITAHLLTTPRHAHGDPKISNMIFDDADQAICMVDFDTLGKTGWSLEMADAIRSWCNPHQEDVISSHIDLNMAERALKGYGSVMRGHFSKKEAAELITHSQAITLCLAVRFLSDVLNERYFSFDRTRFLRAAEHNWLRAQAMYELFLDFSKKQGQLAELVGDLLL